LFSLAQPAAAVVLVIPALQVSCALWVLGEYSASREEVEAALAVIHAGLGPLPLLQLESGAPQLVL
jgi:hypothetical protein